MRNLFIIAILLPFLISCSGEETPETGNIYGIVTIKSSAEPMRATAISLHYHKGDIYSDLQYSIGALL